MQVDPPRLTPPAEVPVPREPAHPVATFLSVVALIGGPIASGWLLFLSMAAAPCAIIGEPCTPEQEAQSQLAGIGALVTFLGVPALVAVARRDARWFYAPFIEVIVVMSIAIVLTVV